MEGKIETIIPENLDQARISQDAMVHNMRAMNYIIYQMKEQTDSSPSNEQKDVHPLERVEFPEKGGILTYMQGQDHPYKGFPLGEFVEKNDIMKKLSKGILSGFFHEAFKVEGKRIKLKSLFHLISGIIAFKTIVRVEIYTFYRFVERVRIKSEKYSDAIRELYRAFSVEIPKESDKTKVLRLQLRDLICMHLEFDNAYRYRFQDISEEHNPALFKKNSIKEILRCLTVMQKREIKDEVKDSWTLTTSHCIVDMRIS